MIKRVTSAEWAVAACWSRFYHDTRNGHGADTADNYHCTRKHDRKDGCPVWRLCHEMTHGPLDGPDQRIDLRCWGATVIHDMPEVVDGGLRSDTTRA